jgi:hypothetical protein
VYHDYSSIKENVFQMNHWREEVGKNARQEWK